MAVRDKATIAAEIASRLADNSAGEISAADVRSVLVDLNDTLGDERGRRVTEVNALTAQDDALRSALLRLVDQAGDLVVVDDPAQWSNAPPAEAQFTFFTINSTIGEALHDDTRALRASDLTGATWYTRNSVGDTAGSVLIARIATGGSPANYRFSVGESAVLPIFANELELKDATWDYYVYSAVPIVGVVTIEKRTVTHHTRYDGELGARGLAQAVAAAGGDASAIRAAIQAYLRDNPLEDSTARAAASDAAKTAGENKAAIGELQARQYPARLSVWPPNVEQHSDFQRDFKAVLNELDEQVLRLDGGSTGTRFVNRFQIKTRNADRAEVLLHDEAWSFTAEGAQELEWNVSAAEFNQLGTSVSTDYVEVWGEFRAVYGGGVNEVRGRTQPFVIGFGREPEWPASLGNVAAEKNAREAADKLLDGRLQTAETDIAALEAGELTTVGKIALLSLTSEPSAVEFRTEAELSAALRRTVIGISNPELLTGDVWVTGEISGQPALARRKWTSATSALNLELSEGVADSVANNIASDRGYSADLFFFSQASGGSEIERLRVRIPLVDLRGLATAESDIDTLEDKVADLETPQLNALVSGAAVAWNVDNGNIGTMTAAHNFTLNISGGSNGEFALLRILQDATGGRTITLHGDIDRDGRPAPVLSAAAGAHDNVLFMRRGTEWVYVGIISDAGQAAGGGFNPQLVFSGNVAITSALASVDAGFDWPADAEYLAVQINPAGSTSSNRIYAENIKTIRNPRFGRSLLDNTPVNAKSAGDNLANVDNDALGFIIDVSLSTHGVGVLFGRTSANRALIQVSGVSADPAPLVVAKI